MLDPRALKTLALTGELITTPVTWISRSGPTDGLTKLPITPLLYFDKQELEPTTGLDSELQYLSKDEGRASVSL